MHNIPEIIYMYHTTESQHRQKHSLPGVLGHNIPEIIYHTTESQHRQKHSLPGVLGHNKPEII